MRIILPFSFKIIYRNLDRDRHPWCPRSRIYYEVLLGLLTPLVICLPACLLLSLLLVAGFLCKVILVCVVVCGIARFCSVFLFSWVGVVSEDAEKLVFGNSRAVSICMLSCA